MLTKFRPWLPCIGLALAVGVLAAGRRFHTPTTPPDETRLPVGAPRPTLLEVQTYQLQNTLAAAGVTVVPCRGRPDAYYFFDGEPDPAALDGLPAEEGFAGRWRGAALAEIGAMRQAPPVSPTPHELLAGPFHFFGDAELLERVRKVMGMAPDQSAPVVGGAVQQ